MNLGPSVKIHNPFLVALTQNNAFPIFKINIISVQQDHFANTNPRRREHINHRDIPQLRTPITHLLQRFVRISLLDTNCRFDLVDSPHRTLQNVILVFKPTEKARKNPPNIIHRHLAQILALLITCQVIPQVIGLDILDALSDTTKVNDIYISACYDNPQREQILKMINEKRKQNPDKIVEVLFTQFPNPLSFYSNMYQPYNQYNPYMYMMPSPTNYPMQPPMITPSINENQIRNYNNINNSQNLQGINNNNFDKNNGNITNTPKSLINSELNNINNTMPNLNYNNNFLANNNTPVDNINNNSLGNISNSGNVNTSSSFK